MLSREQLGDIVNCKIIDCNSCSFADEFSGVGSNSKAIKLAENTIVLMNKVENLEMEIDRIKKEIEQLKAQNAAYREKAKEFIELYEAGPCDFVGEVPSLMDLHHRYYCIFKDIGGGQ